MKIVFNILLLPLMRDAVPEEFSIVSGTIVQLAADGPKDVYKKIPLSPTITACISL